MVRTRRESLDRRDLLALHLLEGNLTGAYRRPVEMDRAGAARARAATEFCAGELEVLSHHPQQWRVGLSLDAHCPAIDRESDSGHALPPDVSSRWRLSFAVAPSQHCRALPSRLV